jgi:hypothetical protein
MPLGFIPAAMFAALPGVADIRAINREFERATELGRQEAEYKRKWAAEARAADAVKLAGIKAVNDLNADVAASMLAEDIRATAENKELWRIQKEVAEAVKEARTEEEKFADAARQAHDWLKAKRITAAEEARLIRNAQADLLKHWESETKFEPATLARKGSAEEAGIIAKVQSALLGRDEQLSRLAEIAANTKRAADAADKDRIKAVTLPP